MVCARLHTELMDLELWISRMRIHTIRRERHLVAGRVFGGC